jgi:hypothetical protein
MFILTQIFTSIILTLIMYSFRMQSTSLLYQKGIRLTRREQMLFFEEPRFNCGEIAPSILRAKQNDCVEVLEEKWSNIRKLLQNCGSGNVDTTMR